MLPQACALTERSESALTWLRHTILSVRWREVVWIFGGTEKTQTTAAWDRGTTAVSAEKVRWLVAIGVLRALSARRALGKQKNKPR